MSCAWLVAPVWPKYSQAPVAIMLEVSPAFVLHSCGGV